MDIRRKVAHGGGDARVERAPKGEVAAETHARCADAAGARRQREEVRRRQGGVFVVSWDFLFAGGRGKTFSCVFLIGRRGEKE